MAPSLMAIQPDPPFVSVVGGKATHTEHALGSSLLERDLHQAPDKVVSSSGLYLTLENGSQVLDASGGAAVACIGHGEQRVKKAMMAQMDQVSYCHSLFFSSSATETLARELVQGTRGEMSRAFIVSSGSEAMEAAMKLARQYFLELSPPQPQRVRFIARRESYHGSTIGALSVSGHVTRREFFEPMLLDNISHVSACNAYRGMHAGESTEGYVTRLAQELDEEFVRVGPGRVCAFIAEPVVGAALGCVPAVAGYFKAMKQVCERHGALLVLDEVMCGMGRTGSLHAWEQEGIVPDIQTMGKGLSGGYAPLAAILMKQHVVDALDHGTGSFSHGHTYQGHPVACAAGLETQRIVRQDQLLRNVQRMGDYLATSLRDRLRHHPHVGDIRGRGLFWGIEFVKSRATKEPFHPDAQIAWAIHTRGMLPPHAISLYPCTGSDGGTKGDHVIISPPYNVDAAEIDRIVELTVQIIEDVFAKHGDAQR
ncbi:MAG: hypothetical protein M1838_000850 [Thelocarpon superellum]|nr:MAG: hypothetical protein M1838_000850 [Thelocarpon superellum]